MAHTHKTLEKLVALRRQKAEQGLAIARSGVRRAEEALAALEAELAQLDAPAQDYASLSLSLRNGRPARLAERIKASRDALTARLAELDEAQLALKKALHSEERLREEHGQD